MTAADQAFIDICMALEGGCPLSLEERIILWRVGNEPFSWEIQ